MNGATPSLPVYAFMDWTVTDFSFLAFFLQILKWERIGKIRELYKILCGNLK
jgi:hypothetical protein